MLLCVQDEAERCNKEHTGPVKFPVYSNCHNNRKDVSPKTQSTSVCLSVWESLEKERTVGESIQERTVCFWVSRPPLAPRPSGLVVPLFSPLTLSLYFFCFSPSLTLPLSLPLPPLALWFMPNLCNYSTNRSSQQVQMGWGTDMPHHLRAATHQFCC